MDMDATAGQNNHAHSQKGLTEEEETYSSTPSNVGDSGEPSRTEGDQQTNGHHQGENGHSSDDQAQGQEQQQNGTESSPEEPLPSQPETRQEEKTLIKDIESDHKMKEGQTWYVVAMKWYKEWKEYVGYDYSYNPFPHGKPGPIDNTPIIEYDPDAKPGEEKIKKTASENYDFAVLAPKAWRLLQHWYGGGPALPRTVISTSSYGWSQNLSVEIRPLQVKILKSSASQDGVDMSFSKATTVGALKEQMCTKFNLNPENVRVWDYHNNSKFKLLDDLKQKLEQVQIIEGQPILLEEKDENGKWPETKARSGYGGSSYYSMYSSGPTEPGTVGMANLGNTCFMNSSLQCLSSTKPLVEFFLADKYKDDVNEDNPLGMKGELAEEYAALLKELWSGSHSVVAPRDFKWKLERFAPQFAGYQQHDSQELLGFLLDGLHEDLNRVKKKPYKELKDPEGRPDQDVADEMWEYHKLRNDSIVVDWFQGQLKSTLVCPKCSKISITFDPFMYLSLPLPSKNTRKILVTFFFLSPTKKPIRYGVEVEKFASIKIFKDYLSALSGVNTKAIEVCDVYNSRFFKVFHDNETVDTIQDRDLIQAHEILKPADNEEKEEKEESKVYYFPLIHRRSKTTYYSYSMQSYSGITLFGHPLLLSIENAPSVTYKQLYDIVYSNIQRYLKAPGGQIVRTLADLRLQDQDEGHESEDEEAKAEASQTAKAQREDEEDERVQSHNPSYRGTGQGSSSSDDEPDRALASRYKKKQGQTTSKDQPLFTISLVDHYGTATVDKLVDDDQPLGLKDGSTIAVNWTEAGFEQFYDASIEGDIETHTSARRSSEAEERQDSISLQQCIELFTTTEKLGPEDPWYCNKCKEFQQATKKFDLWRVPPVLVVHLKRFSYKNRYFREKLETFVDYPIHDLDLSSIVQGPTSTPPIYDLYAVSNHYGSLGGGHYTAYAKNKNTGKWHKFDDSHVSSIDESHVKTPSAYVLFYQRKDTVQPVSSTQTTSPSEGAPPAQED